MPNEIGQWKKVKTISTHHFGNFYHVDVDEVTMPGGGSAQYSVVRIKPYVMILPITANGQIIFVRQHRYTTNHIMIELPSGGSDGQDPLLAAQRELEEEAGVVSTSWSSLGQIEDSNGIVDQIGYMFLARDVQKIENPKLDPADKDMFEVLTFSIEEVKAKIANGEIFNAPTICTFAKAMLMGLL
ncbi:MAG: NUDIX hydrolase [bacterium]|nr:NUDIX hydrolase [bacterium]